MMESVTLTKAWLEHVPGDTVEVDPLRAQWLRDNKYASARKGSAELKPPAIEPELPSPFPGVEIVPPPARDEVPDGHLVSRSKRKSLMKELSEPLALDVKDVKEP